MTECSSAITAGASEDPAAPPEDADRKQELKHLGAVRDHDGKEATQHPLLTWTGLAPGDVVSLKLAITGHSVIGSVESKTSDGLIIWIRDQLNDRKLFHYNDCESVQLLSRRCTN